MTMFTTLKNGIEIDIKVVPNAKRTKVVGPLGRRLKVTLAAPPEKGKANKALINLLADKLGVRKNSITVTAGQTSPKKRVLVIGVDEKNCRQKLLNKA